MAFSVVVYPSVAANSSEWGSNSYARCISGLGSVSGPIFAWMPGCMIPQRVC